MPLLRPSKRNGPKKTAPPRKPCVSASHRWMSGGRGCSTIPNGLQREGLLLPHCEGHWHRCANQQPFSLLGLRSLRRLPLHMSKAPIVAVTCEADLSNFYFFTSLLKVSARECDWGTPHDRLWLRA